MHIHTYIHIFIYIYTYIYHQKYDDSYAIDLPGGRRNLGESMDEALRRETIEESGIVLFSENFSEYDDDHPSCQFKIDEFIDSDMCFHVIHQDVYHMGSSLSLSHSFSSSEPSGASGNVPIVSSPLHSASSPSYIPN
jgi:8-oxo-dGTP pyrophosphatase MutT (NUDIX family)